MKKITVHRPEERFNKNFPYNIVVGDQILTSLDSGEKKTIEIPKKYEKMPLQAKVMWCGSKKIPLDDIRRNGEITVKGNKLFNKSILIFGAIVPIIVLLISNILNIPKIFSLGFFIVFTIVMFSTVTVFRKQWIDIE